MAITGVNSTTADTAAAQKTASTTTGGTDALGNTQTFLKLLVAQIKNQNPLNPTDGVQFLTQLAQFTQLEQSMGIRQDVAAMRAAVETTQADDKAAASSSKQG